ncbi:MAG: hypothetical protein J4N95_03265 [Chloroflexi bacterium]|nr:hypothetical protein [Chloroflexota bacterium]MCI0889634.1 hypothetical protein [Chloroflexota bacterium]
MTALPRLLSGLVAFTFAIVFLGVFLFGTAGLMPNPLVAVVALAVLLLMFVALMWAYRR